jgi:myo-inositol-1(or 4)-monophosphatase
VRRRSKNTCSVRQATEFAEFARELCLQAGALLKSAYSRPRSISHKGPIDLVTSADIASEKLIISKLRKVYPEHGILAEEREEITGDSAIRWVIDPLDGTTNFAHGYPAFCVSIGVQYAGATVAGAVYDPLRDELFSAISGRGAWLGRKRIHVSATKTIANALCATGFPYDIHSAAKDNLANFRRIIKQARGIRRGGSAALDLSYVACGRFDFYWEMKLSPWDTAAGALIAAESGATVTDFSGRPFSSGKPLSIEKREIAAGAPALYREALALIR